MVDIHYMTSTGPDTSAAEWYERADCRQRIATDRPSGNRPSRDDRFRNVTGPRA